MICKRETLRAELCSNVPALCWNDTKCKADESIRNRKSATEVEAGAHRGMTTNEEKMRNRLSSQPNLNV